MTFSWHQESPRGVSWPFAAKPTPRKRPMRHHGRMRILVAEDEPLLAGAVAEWLRGDTHAVDVVHDGAAALERLAVNDYDVVVLDRDLPAVHGDQVCRSIVDGEHTVGVLMLTAAGELDDRIAGLALGA